MEVDNEVNRSAAPPGNPQNAAASRPRTNETKPTWLSNINMFQLLLAFRLANALLVRTFFQPDEYYQALEPAWQFAFGDGSAAWITWEWRQHIRSALHPALFALVYRAADLVATALALSRPNRAELLLAAPKMLQAGIAAAGDYYTWTLGRRVYGRDSGAAWATLLLTVCSPWQWFCSTRTFSNCLETTLTIMALNEWPWDWTVSGEDSRKGRSVESGRLQITGLRKALLYAATATVLRPTNVLIWATVAAYTTVRAFALAERENSPGPKSAANPVERSGHSAWSKVLLLVREVGLCGSTVLAVSAIIDRLFYGTWTFPPYNFLYFNVVQSLAVFYGNNNWHYYLSEGYPLLLTTSLLFTVACLIKGFDGYKSFTALSASSRAILRALAITCVALPAALSILTHKEVRFIYPILPSLQIITALPVSDFNLPFATRGISADHVGFWKRNQRKLLAVILVLNVFIAGYVTQVHNSGLLALPEYLRHEFEALYLPHDLHKSQANPNPSFQNTHSQNMTVAFLMPCHSVPWRSHFQYPPTQSHVGIQAWALTCEPPLHLTDALAKKSYMDEADVFYDDPRAWIRRNMARHLPVGVDQTKPRNSKPGIHVADEALGHRNKKLWDGSRSTSKDIKSHTGLDITDLLPHLSTSPSPSTNGSLTLSFTVERNTPTRRPWPEYIIFFAQLERTLTQILYSYGPRSEEVYSECWKGFNSHWHDDWRRKGDVIVWCLNPPAPKIAISTGTTTESIVEDSNVGRTVDVKVKKSNEESERRGDSSMRIGVRDGDGDGDGNSDSDRNIQGNFRKAVGDRGNTGGKQTIVKRAAAAEEAAG